MKAKRNKETGVCYHFVKIPGFKKFEYLAIAPSYSFISEVYLRNRLDALELINVWNGEGADYRLHLLNEGDK